MFGRGLALLTAAMAVVSVTKAQLGADHITEAPPTVYEDGNKTAQNMDFDAENNMFIAHSGWYNDLLVYYYKFRMYTPSTYPGLIAPGSTSADVPIQKVFMVTTTGDLDGLVGKPIVQFHTSDENDYSDFMEINFVVAPAGYVADTFQSEGDVMQSGAEVVASGMVLNLPLVPNGATLQDPAKGGTVKAPIAPVLAWYKGVEVTTYVFECNDQAAADFFASTRTEDPNDPAFKITVTQFATSTLVNAIPLWHVNQFTRGVEEGVNSGGPSSTGMRNIINLDRQDGDAYSPLWSILWVTELPINYLADEVSNAADLVPADGFTFVATPMFVNCPDVGLVGTEVNPAMAEDHQVEIDLSLESNWILGSHMSLIMKGNVPVTFLAGDGSGGSSPTRDNKGGSAEIATTQTNMMGAYEYELLSTDVPQGTKEIVVVAKNATIRTIAVVGEGETQDPTPSGACLYKFGATTVLASIAVVSATLF